MIECWSNKHIFVRSRELRGSLLEGTFKHDAAGDSEHLTKQKTNQHAAKCQSIHFHLEFC